MPGLPFPEASPSALLSLHILLLGYTWEYDPTNLFDVAAFAAWDAAPQLAILVVECARLVASRDATIVRLTWPPTSHACR